MHSADAMTHHALNGATDRYLNFDGRRIAKRGKSGTLHAMTWISLEPGVGVVVRDVPMPESESGGGSSERDFVFTVAGTTAVSGFGNAKRRLDLKMAASPVVRIVRQPKISDWRLHYR
jgi:hypothetical protein